MIEKTQNKQLEPIALVGIGCRFPGAATPGAFWELLREGRDAISDVPSDRWDIMALYDPDPNKPGKMTSRWGGFLDQVDQFDWRAFRMLPREVRSLDPQQRLLLEVAWEALEDAGITLSDVAGSRTSVTIGIGWSDYLRMQVRDWSRIDGYTATGNRGALAANRISYTFDLKGPSVALDTGCSSSLSAIHLACQSLWTGEATLALVGGVNLIISPDSTLMVSKAGLLAADGRCKTLDAQADGFVRGEGAGIIVLKPLSDVTASDRVYALLKGIAVNHNGHNEWLIAPSQSAQEALLSEAYQRAGVDPGEIDYVELHGTGFRRGDALEARAIGNVLGRSRQRTRPCLIGSVKTNIGHLEAASGIASTIKVALALYHRTVPPTLHLKTINPDIPLHEWNLAVPQHASPWPEKEFSELAAVTTISLTGANAHLVLEALPQKKSAAASEKRDAWHVLPLSARTEEALRAQATAWYNFLQARQDAQSSWTDICYTASARRSHHEYRLAVPACTPDSVAHALDTFLHKEDPSSVISGQAVRVKRHKLVFVFGHKPTQWLLNGCDALMKEPAFRSSIEAFDQIFQVLTGKKLFPKNNYASCMWCTARISNRIVATLALQSSLVALWQSWGIAPVALLAEGVGEIAAAYIAGAITLSEAVQLALALSSSDEETELALLRSLQFKPTALPIYSAQVGLLNQEKRMEVAHWSESLKKPDLAVSVIDLLLSEQYDVFVELGPPSTLCEAIVARQSHSEQSCVFLSTCSQEEEMTATLLEALGALYTLGYDIDWSALYQHTSCQLVTVPTYQWQRERLWLEWLDREELSTPPELHSRAVSLAQSQNGQAEAGIGSGDQEDSPGTSERPLEEALASLWAEVLGLEEVHVSDNFFELGGHSLLAGQLQARIREAFQVEISLSDLLQHATPQACAALIESNRTIQSLSMLAEMPQITSDPNQSQQPFPITDVQQAYWIGRSTAFELGNVGNHGYIEVDAVNIDLQRCTWCIRQLIARHDMLRAILLPDGRQKILPHVPPFEVKEIDLRGLGPGIRAAQLGHLRESMDHEMIPIDRWPAFQVVAVRLDDQRTRLYLSIESFFIDAWSMNLLIKEFLRLYYEPEIDLPRLALSFRDYILAEEMLQTTEIYRRSQAYWMERLASLPAAPDLPLAISPGAIEKPYFTHREARLEAQQWQQLKARAARAGLTPSGVLLAAFAELLTTWSKNERFSINLSIFNRLPLHAQVNEIVGDFTSLVVLMVDNSEPISFEKRAQQLQGQLWRDLDHSYFSGVKVLRELTKLHGGGVRAIMPIVFTSLLIQDTASPYPSPWQKTVYCVSQTPQVFLDHQVLEQAGALVFHWQTVEEIFPAGMIDAMFVSYSRFLERLACDETCWQTQRQQLVPIEQLTQRSKVNATQGPITDALLHTLFEKQAISNPQRIAVVSPGRSLTYKEVLDEATAIAHNLRQWGARPNQLVGVVMEKGWEQVVAALAILQSGAAYLPIDARLPHERLMYLLEHGEVRYVLTQSWIDEKVAWPEPIQRICVDHAQGCEHDLPPLEPVQKPEDLAYVIYTSGSTGLPKGVMIDHRGAVNTILDINQRFKITSHDRVLALSALNFDLSVYDIFGLLAAGGGVVIPATGANRDPASWLELLVRERVTIWNSVPALMQMLVDYAQLFPEAVQSTCLRLALWSGDWIPLSLPDKCRQLFHGCETMSLGGATEASIWSILYPIQEVDPSWKSVPYGKPMVNQTFAVLNDRLEPCPVWVPGQLYIGGIGLAKGYWHDERKTEASFFYHSRTGERLYRTGDMGRYLPDGTIEFLGREDFQVKIQGYRIELGEIEETLMKHPVVQTAVVNAAAGTGGDKRLIGYVILKSEPGVSQQKSVTQENGAQSRLEEVVEQALRSYLLEKLPEYMIPSAFMVLESLPLSANGKVDRKQLPVPHMAARNLSHNYVAPVSELERKIAEVWQEMLPSAQVGIHDNFFDLGGNSVLMVRAYTKLYQVLGRDLSLIEMFFQYPTIYELTQYLTQGAQQMEIEGSEDSQSERLERRRSAMQQEREARRKSRLRERDE